MRTEKTNTERNRIEKRTQDLNIIYNSVKKAKILYNKACDKGKLRGTIMQEMGVTRSKADEYLMMLEGCKGISSDWNKIEYIIPKEEVKEAKKEFEVLKKEMRLGEDDGLNKENGADSVVSKDIGEQKNGVD